MAAAKTHRGVIARNFKDAGTGISYAAGDSKSIPAGAFRNYLRAGLVTLPKAAAEPSEPPAE